MADKKVSALSAITNLSQDDLFMVVDDPAGTPTSKKVTVGNLFGNVVVETTFKKNTTFSSNTTTFSSNVVIGGTNIKTDVADRMQVANTTLLVNDRMQVANAAPKADPTFTGTATTPTLVVSTKSSNPATSNASTESITAGTMFYSNTYLYIATGANTIKRVALSTF